MGNIKEDNAFLMCVEAGVVEQCPKCAHIIAVNLDNAHEAYVRGRGMYDRKDRLAQPFDSHEQLMDHIRDALRDAENNEGGCTCDSPINPMK